MKISLCKIMALLLSLLIVLSLVAYSSVTFAENGDYTGFEIDPLTGNSTEIEDNHTLSDWQSDEQYHWRVCSDCGQEFYKTEHTVSDWIFDTPASIEAPGSKHKECTVCGCTVETEVIPQLPRGDVNKDEKINNKDITLLFQYLAGWDVSDKIDLIASDLNNDTVVNNKDLVKLFQYLSGWNI